MFLPIILWIFKRSFNHMESVDETRLFRVIVRGFMENVAVDENKSFIRKKEREIGQMGL